MILEALLDNLFAPRGDVGGGGGRALFGAFEAAGGEVERIPPQAEAGGQQQHQSDGDAPGQQPAEGRQRPEKARSRHGKILRSSSKWRPSRRLAQSPPQTIGVSSSAAATLKASAMRG